MIEVGKWKKGSRSNGTGGSNCVEVAGNGNGRVFVRNSINIRSMISFNNAEWAAFIESAKLGEFDLPGGEGSAGAEAGAEAGA